MAPQREWFEKDYYRVLGVSDTASQKDIRSAFRKLSRQYHPDANPDDNAAEERFKEVSAAYDVVGDAEKRKEYDEVRKLGPLGATFGGPAPRSRWTGPQRRTGRHLYVTVRVKPHPLFGRRGNDLTVTVPITFPGAALGADVAVSTLDGGPVKVRIPGGTRSGRTFRVRGKGEVARLRADLAKLRKQAAEAVADAHRQHKRELVPLCQAVAVFDTGRKG